MSGKHNKGFTSWRIPYLLMIEPSPFHSASPLGFAKNFNSSIFQFFNFSLSIMH